jgi:hypothetical protein
MDRRPGADDLANERHIGALLVDPFPAGAVRSRLLLDILQELLRVFWRPGTGRRKPSGGHPAAAPGGQGIGDLLKRLKTHSSSKSF